MNSKKWSFNIGKFNLKRFFLIMVYVAFFFRYSSFPNTPVPNLSRRTVPLLYILYEAPIREKWRKHFFSPVLNRNTLTYSSQVTSNPHTSVLELCLYTNLELHTLSIDIKKYFENGILNIFEFCLCYLWIFLTIVR